MSIATKLPIRRFDQLQQFLDVDNNASLHKQENALLMSEENFQVSGFCYVCDQPSQFLVDFMHCQEAAEGQVRIPNWRERLVCPHCNLNNRMRAIIHVVESIGQTKKESHVYITEQTTHLFQILQGRYPKLKGSEFLGEDMAPGQINDQGIRHEDMTSLSFADNSFECILSFDVLEHIPDYKAALRECGRCLKKQGTLFLTAPFVINAANTLVRASLNDDGSLTHHLAPEFHGDPVNPDSGILCYYHFGWDVLEELKLAGFSSSHVNLYWSMDFGYLGGNQIIITATK
jgi:SAM-dependent methyltransferase